MLLRASQDITILSEDDPEPVETVNPGGASRFLLTCEHAGRAVPSRLRGLGLDAPSMDLHIAYDIGAEGLSRALSSLLDAPLIMQRYSRLVVDSNRPFEAADCMPGISDGTPVPANQLLSDEERSRRFAEIHAPFHQAVAAFLDRRETHAKPTILISVHSFTRRLFGRDREWLLGALSNRDRTFADLFLKTFTAANPGIIAAHNEPYVVDDMSDYTIPVHGEARGISHVLLEIRNDQIATPDGQARWARLLSDALPRAAATIDEKGNSLVR
ncbi:MAG: N-formylglutamate amidohydrolase [Pseudaminobacter sp.]|nr:N-formylglutamate amidohydrolase [Pseudaminobacter sp.]